MAWLLLPMRVGNQSITSAIPHGNNRSVRIKEGTASDSELRVSLRVAHGLEPKEQRAKSEGQRAKSKGQRAKGKERRAKGKERRAKAKERRAKCEEPLPFCPFALTSSPFALRYSSSMLMPKRPAIR